MENNELLEYLRDNLESWDFLMESREAQIETLAKYCATQIAGAATNQDSVEEIIVLDSLYEKVQDAFKIIELPEDFQLAPTIDLEKAKSDFKAFVQEGILVKPVSLETLADTDYKDNFSQYLRFVTTKTKERGFLTYWAQTVGLTELLGSVPVKFSYEDIKSAYMVAATLEALSRKAASADETKVKMATAGNVRV